MGRGNEKPQGEAWAEGVSSSAARLTASDSMSGKSSEALREPPAVSLEQLSPAQSWVLQ